MTESLTREEKLSLMVMLVESVETHLNEFDAFRKCGFDLSNHQASMVVASSIGCRKWLGPCRYFLEQESIDDE